MDDLTTYALLTASFFFVAVGVGLLFRYRQVSQKINASTDLGLGLWQSLEQRLRKQDERILDMMGRLEVVQARLVAGTGVQTPAPPPVSPPLPPTEKKPSMMSEPSPVVQQPESRPVPQVSQASQPSPARAELDETHLAAIRLLGESPKNTRQLTDTLKKSREHTARIMKELFGMGLVSRNDSAKPFVYQLTDDGRRYLV